VLEVDNDGRSRLMFLIFDLVYDPMLRQVLFASSAYHGIFI
jgi:hypothetical protein